MNSIADTEAELNRSMTADPDHARALEVLQAKDAYGLPVTDVAFPYLVALYAAGEKLSAVLASEPPYHFGDARNQWIAKLECATREHTKALANVAKAVLP